MKYNKNNGITSIWRVIFCMKFKKNMNEKRARFVFYTS